LIPLYQNEHRSGVEIPFGVSPEDIMTSLEIGHGYKWIVLVRRPVIVAHGAPTLGNMPELLMTGYRSLIVSGGDPAYVDRIRQVLAMLQRQSQSPIMKSEGVSVG
jgi:hypothetical protein